MALERLNVQEKKHVTLRGDSGNSFRFECNSFLPYVFDYVSVAFSLLDVKAITNERIRFSTAERKCLYYPQMMN